MNPLYQQYANILDTVPNARRTINTIIKAEGTDRYKTSPYNTAFGGDPITDLSKHPNKRYNFQQTDGRMNTTNAAGAVQWMKQTWDPLAKKLGITDFSQRSQDVATIAKIAERGGLDAMIKGDLPTLARKVAPEWASFPGAPASYKQRTISNEQLRRNWESAGTEVITTGNSSRKAGASGVARTGGGAKTTGASTQDGQIVSTTPTAIAAQQSQEQANFADLMNSPVGNVGVGSQAAQQSWLSPLGSTAQNAQNPYQISWVNPASLPNF